MKHTILLIIAASLLVSSCSGPKTIAKDETTLVTGYNFTEYTDQGFLFTPEAYNGKYQSMGLITVTLWPKITKRTIMEKRGKEYKKVEKFIQGDINVNKAIAEIHKVASEMGADAISRFDVNPTSRMNGTLRVHGVEISGFAIKRES